MPILPKEAGERDLKLA